MEAREETGVAPAIGVTALPGTEKERGRSGSVCTAVGLMEGFEGDRGGHHEGDDDGGDPDEGLLAVHPGFHGGGGRGGLGGGGFGRVLMWWPPAVPAARAQGRRCGRRDGQDRNEAGLGDRLAV